MAESISVQLEPDMLNTQLSKLAADIYYHFGLTSEQVRALFEDIKYVVMNGSAKRAEDFAKKAATRLGYPIENLTSPIAEELVAARAVFERHGVKIPIPGQMPSAWEKTERFSGFKVGPILSFNHQMGLDAIEIAIREMIKMLCTARAKINGWYRNGTSGGFAVNAGDVVLAHVAINHQGKPFFNAEVLDRIVEKPAWVDPTLAQRLFEVRGKIPALILPTASARGFYDEQGRSDSWDEPPFTEEELNRWLWEVLVHSPQDRGEEGAPQGIGNMEMEMLRFFSEMNRFHQRNGVWIPSAGACAAIVTRREQDQVTSTPEELAEFSNRPDEIILADIAREEGRTLLPAA